MKPPNHNNNNDDAAIDRAYQAYVAGLRDLLTAANAKLTKGQAQGYLTAGIHLSPHKASGKNMCFHASPGCIRACLDKAGHGAFNNTQIARIARTRYFSTHTKQFMDKLVREVRAFTRKAAKHHLIPALRPNLTSDVHWAKVKTSTGSTLFTEFPDLQVYDYTKDPGRMTAFLAGELPDNYHLTFSRSEQTTNHRLCISFLESGGNVAAVFAGKRPASYWGFPVIDGDQDDLTFLRPKGVIFGLTPKGVEGKKDKSGFVIH